MSLLSVSGLITGLLGTIFMIAAMRHVGHKLDLDLPLTRWEEFGRPFFLLVIAMGGFALALWSLL